MSRPAAPPPPAWPPALRPVLLLLLILLLIPAAGAVAGEAAASPCPDGRPMAGDVGLRGLSCSGPTASCAIHVEDGTGRRHELAVEPVITAVEPASPADGELAPGDMLVAVDGHLVTTTEGGRRLANLEVGTRVTLLTRRDGRLREVSLRPVAGCGIRSLEVRR